MMYGSKGLAYEIFGQFLQKNDDFEFFLSMGEVKKWPDLRSQIPEFRDKQIVPNLTLFNFCEF